MIAQAYYKDIPMTIRIFQDRNSFKIAELPLKEATQKAADAALKKLKIRRRSKWEEISWGCEAKIRFVR